MSDNEPPERDVKDFEFVQLCKFRVSPSTGEVSIPRGKLLACSSQYGLLVYATAQGFTVLQTSQLQAVDESLGKERTKVVVEDVPKLVEVALAAAPLSMDISGDGQCLAVVIREMGQLNILFYDIRSFADKSSTPVPFGKSRVNASPSASLHDLSWNPAVMTMLAVCTSDGNVELLDITDTPKLLAALPAAAGATCFCWSPKGKQLLVGKKDGTLAQYDHNLVEKKQWACPSVLNGPYSVVDIVWQSTYVFLAAYLPAVAQPGDQPVAVMTSSNKENKTTYINFDDICFGSGEERKAQYFFHLVQKWDLIVMASSNATEATVVARNLDDKVSWEHWNLEDTSRAEFPLTSSSNDSFPVGLTVDYSPHKEIVLSEVKRIPASPILYMLSTDGVLLAFHMFYSHRDAASATIPPQPLTAAGARDGKPDLAGPAASSPAPKPTLTPQVAQTPAQPPPPYFPTPSTPASAAAALVQPTPSSLSTPAAATTTPQLGFSSFTSQSPAATITASNTSFPTGPSFQFAGLSAKIDKAAGGDTPGNQKPLSQFQTTPSAGFGQTGSSGFAFGGPKPGLSSFAFGGPSTTTQSSAFASVASPFSSTPATSGAAKPMAQSQPFSGFGQALSKPATSLPQASGPAAGITSTPVAAVKPDDSKPTFPTTPSSAQASSIFGMGQLRPPAPSAFTSRPISADQGQPAQAPQTPSNGLVVGNVVRPSSPATTPSFGQPAAPKPAPVQPSQTPQQSGASLSSQPGQTPPAQPQPQQPSQPTVTPPGSGQRLGESQKSIEATVDSAFTQNIVEELIDFQRELLELRKRARLGTEVKTVGTKEEMYSLRQDTERKLNFTKDIMQTTKEQLRESQDQKSLCYSLFAMVEECKSKQERDLDPNYHSLLQGRSLDPASSEKMKQLHQMSQAIEQSVVEVDKVLDAQWEEHLAAKKKEKRLSTPIGDTIYKSIKNNHLLINSHRHQIDKLEEQLRKLKLYTKAANRDMKPFSMFQGEKLSPLQPTQKPGLTLTSAVANGMTPEKVTKLREVLSQRQVPRVKSTAPANLSMSRIVTTPPTKTAGAAPSPKQQSHSQPQPQQQQQRKHPLHHHQAQTPAGPPRSQLGPPTGQLRLQKDQLPASPLTQVQPSPTQTVTPQTKGQSIPVLTGGSQPVSTAPTSFSGLAYFKPSAVSSPAVALSSVGVKSPGGMTPGLNGTKPSLPSSLASGTSDTKPSLPVGGAPKFGSLFGSSQSQTLAPQSAVPGDMHHYYEDITPTETDETNDEDDDYDEEDNGYEDEEEEEDEEETGFVGMGQGQGVTIPSGSQATSLGQLLAQPSSKSGQVQSLFGMSGGSAFSGAAGFSASGAGASTSIFKLPQNTGAGGQAFSPVKSGSQQQADSTSGVGLVTSGSAASKDLFGAKTSTTTPAATQASDLSLTRSGSNGFSFSTPKLSGSTTSSGIFAFGKTTSTTAATAASTTTTSTTATASSDAAGGQADSGTKPVATSLFGLKTDTKPGTGLTFGGPALFGQKPATAAPSTSGAGAVFGSMATPSKGIGFGDLAGQGQSQPDQQAKEGGTATTQGTAVSKDSAASTATTTAPTSTSTAPTSPASAFSFTQTAKDLSTAGEKTTPASTGLFGGAVTSPASTNVFGGGHSSGSPSVFGGKSPTQGSTFSFGTAPSTSGSSAAGFSFTGASSTPEGTSATAAATTIASAVTTTIGTPSQTTSSEKAEQPTFGVVDSTTEGSPAPASTTPGMPATVASTSPASPTQSFTPTVSAATSTSATPATSTPSVFGGGTTITGGSPSLFGAASSSTPSSSAPAFGGGPAATTAASSLFGTPSTSATTPLFGSKSATATTSATTTAAPAFGGGSSGGSSVFGGGAPLFGSATTSSAAPSFGFGSASGVSSSSGGLFGSSAISSSGTSVFGGSGGPGLFGQSSATSSAGSGSGLFGQSNTTSSAGGSGGGLFGQTSATSAGGGTGLFGTPASTSSVFGSSSSAGQGGSVFGQATTSTAFGGGFSQPASTESSLFGQSSGGGGGFGQSSSSSGGLLGFGGLGGKASEEKAKQNVFGTPQVFGDTSNQNTNLFGSGGSSSFGGLGSSGSGFSPPSSSGFSGAGSGVAATGFNVTVSQQTTSGFGGAPAFGSAPSFGGTAVFGTKPGGFGSSPGFGSAPAFGSSPSFSSPSSAGFGSSSGGGFSSFANAPAPSFGDLAHSSPSSSAFGSGGGGFGSTGQSQSTPFGGGGFGSQQPSMSSGGSLFGQAAASPGFGGGQSSGFGNPPSFGSNPAFSSYRG